MVEDITRLELSGLTWIDTEASSVQQLTPPSGDTLNANVRPFIFTYRVRATAHIAPVATVSCEGIICSDGFVLLRDIAAKTWYSFDTLNDMFDHFGKHGKGTIRPLPMKESVPIPLA